MTQTTLLFDEVKRARVNSKKRVEELQKYLDETDWYDIREFKTHKPTPVEIDEARQAARDEISAIKAKYSL